MRDHAADLPPTREACRALLVELATEMAAIKTEMATSDLERQRRRGKVDPIRFQEAKTALLNKQRKDRLIEVLRADYDDAAWQAALDRARRLMEARSIA